MPRGGRRNGTPGAAYSNRTDLQSVKVAPGQQYGKGAAQRAAQEAVPMAGRPTMPAGGAPAAPPTGRPPSPGPQPGDLTPLDAPSTRPNEPVTTGLSVGAGAGPEALGPLADKTDGIDDLAQYLPMLEFIASQPGSSGQTRNFVRQLRGSIRPL